MNNEIIPRVSQAMKDVLTRRAEDAAEAANFVRRRVKVTGSNFTQAVVFGWLSDPDATLEGLCQTAAAVDLEITPQGLEQRFTPEASELLLQVLEAAVAEVITADPIAIPVLQRFNGVYIDDSTVVTLPDCLADIWPGFGGSGDASRAAVKLQVRWDVLHGTLDGPHLVPGRTHDRDAARKHVDLPVGSLHIADLGYWKLDKMAELSATGVFWLSRPQVQTQIFDSQDRRWDLATFVAAQRGDQFDVEVQLGVTHRLPARLVGKRVLPQVAAERRRRLKYQAKRKGQTVSQARLALADWVLFVTNVPGERLTVAEALVLGRMRWQIELLFKLWKSQGQIDESRSRKPWRILCELYAKLIGAVIQHWVFLVGNWIFPDRSLVKAAQAVRRHAMTLMIALSSIAHLNGALHVLKRVLSAGSRINKSKVSPRTWQLLLAFEDGALA